MGILHDMYLQEATKTITRILQMEDPSISEKDVQSAVESIMKSTMKDPTIEMDNNVTGAHGTITLSQLCGWLEHESPVVSGNATFYCQPSVMASPTSKMLRDLKQGRKAVKRQMFQYKPGSDEYEALDLDQGNKKVIMNAEYGGSGTPTAAFYTKYSPAATTLLAQSIITTMAAFFEGYVGDNQKFFSVDECFDWMNKVIQKDEKIPKWINIPSAMETAHRIKMHFYQANPSDFPAIDAYVESCTDKQRTYLFYANNFKDLIRRHPKIQNWLRDVMVSLPNLEAAIKEVPEPYKDQFVNSDNDPVEQYNKWMSKQMFLNPYEIPETIKKPMDEFIAIMTQFVYAEYITPDSIVKLNNHKRNTVLLVDTDSNIINANIFVTFVLDEIFRGETFGRNRMYNDMILVNVLSATLAISVAKLLDYYGRCHHMDKDARAELAMKNEFMFRRLFLMKTKKRYAASIVLREGNIIVPFKAEIKGMDFIKAGVSDDVSERFKKLLCDYILYSDDLELHALMNELKQFEREILEDLRAGGTRYLKQQQYKAEGGYSKIRDSDGNTTSGAWRLPVFKGSAVWNELYPNNKINSLDRVCIVKLIVSKPQDLDVIKDDFPQEYAMVLDKIFNNPNPELRNVGLKYICVPNTLECLPRWLLPLIDYDLIISDVISSFRSVLESLNIEDVSFKTPGGNASVVSCLISL